jgi:hypothetical protein
MMAIGHCRYGGEMSIERDDFDCPLKFLSFAKTQVRGKFATRPVGGMVGRYMWQEIWSKTATLFGEGGKPAPEWLSRALRVLTDDKSRARYDATGDDSGPAPDNVLGRIIEMIRTALQACIQSAPDPYKIDLIAVLKSYFRQKIAGVRKEIAEGEAEVKKLKKFASKFRSKKKPNYLRQMIESDVIRIEHSLADALAHIADMERAIEIVGDHEFDFDEPFEFFRDGAVMYVRAPSDSWAEIEMAARSKFP